MIKVNFTQNEIRSMRLLRKWIPRRWYSAQMKIAEIMYPPLHRLVVSVTSRLCGLGASRTRTRVENHRVSGDNGGCRKLKGR